MLISRRDEKLIMSRPSVLVDRGQEGTEREAQAASVELQTWATATSGRSDVSRILCNNRNSAHVCMYVMYVM